MSESLNRAFIKAYDKERSSAANRKAHAEDRRAQDVASLFMQFDTTTVAVPSPHFGDPQTHESLSDAPAVVAKTVAPAPPGVEREALATAAAAQADVAQADVAQADVAQADAELRESIALQMMQAGGWEDQRIDAFMGSMPVRPARPVEETQASVPAARAAVAVARQDMGQMPPVQPTVVTENSPPPLLAAAIPELPDLVPPHAPALSTPRSVVAPSAEELESQLAQRERPGDIFRLDRPSYTQEFQSRAESDLYEDSHAQLSDSAEEFSTSRSSLDVVSFGSPDGATGETASAVQPQASGGSRGKEADLRRARMRIFNPVWEVDSLQWSSVCLALVEQLDGGLKHVAENLLSACQEGLQILAVTSPQRGEGSTTVACCLALLAGKHGLNVAIIDGDMDKPTLTYQTNLDIEQDWRSAILEHIPLEEVAVHSIDDQVTLVPLLTPVDEHELAVDDDRIASMMQALSESFDLVIIDAGQMHSARNLVASLGERGMVSAAVAVVDHRSSTSEQVEACLSRIRHSGIASIGLVENFAA